MLWFALWISGSIPTCWLFGRLARVGMNELQPHAAVDTGQHSG